MKDIAIANCATIGGSEIGQGENRFVIKPVVGLGEGERCAVHFVEVGPGNSAFGYHWHEMNEEVFYIISGSGIVRTEKGELAVKAGDAIAFPAGKSGAHSIRNASDSEKLVYIDFDAVNIPDLVHLPDIGKAMYTGPHSSGMIDEPETTA